MRRLESATTSPAKKKKFEIAKVFEIKILDSFYPNKSFFFFGNLNNSPLFHSLSHPLTLTSNPPSPTLILATDPQSHGCRCLSPSLYQCWVVKSMVDQCFDRFRGFNLDALLDMSSDDLVKLFTTGARRRYLFFPSYISSFIFYLFVL